MMILIKLQMLSKLLIVRGAPAIGVSGAFGLGLAALQSKATSKEELLF